MGFPAQKRFYSFQSISVSTFLERFCFWGSFRNPFFIILFGFSYSLHNRISTPKFDRGGNDNKKVQTGAPISGPNWVRNRVSIFSHWVGKCNGPKFK